MIGKVVDFNGKNMFTKKFNAKLKQYKYVECDNLELLITILCSTVGDLYIPNSTLLNEGVTVCEDSENEDFDYFSYAINHPELFPELDDLRG